VRVASRLVFASFAASCVVASASAWRQPLDVGSDDDIADADAVDDANSDVDDTAAALPPEDAPGTTDPIDVDEALTVDALATGAVCASNAHTGDYCAGDKVNGGVTGTLYRCNGPGPATVVTRCASGCFIAPAGQDDSCRTTSTPPTCDDNAHTGEYCGGDKVTQANPSTLYHCDGPGPASVVQACSNGCFVAPAGEDDFCNAAVSPTCDSNAFTGEYCAGDKVSHGVTGTLYHCDGPGRATVVERCGSGCRVMPAGRDDVCAAPPSSSPPASSSPPPSSSSPPSAVGAVPASLIDALDATPYVEESCTSTSAPGWPYAAKRCSYASGGIHTTVVTATPSPERVGKWIMDSVTLIPSVQALKTRAPSKYEAALRIIANAVMEQSSRIFPLSGGIIEDMGTGSINYPFDRGIAVGCHGGCYCRINSLHRTEWCRYQAGVGAQSYDRCINDIGDSGLTDAWGNRCLQNHVRAWTSDRNEHFRARAWIYQQSIRHACPRGDSCSPDRVLQALREAL